MNERQKIYDKLSAVLTDYEEKEHDTLDYIEAAETLYDMLVEIQNEWETIITAEEETI